jgi:hypothetical protein
VAAFLRAEPGQQLDKSPLIDYMREKLLPSKTPRHWYALEAFPLDRLGQDAEVQAARALGARRTYRTLRLVLPPAGRARSGKALCQRKVRGGALA